MIVKMCNVGSCEASEGTNVGVSALINRRGCWGPPADEVGWRYICKGLIGPYADGVGCKWMRRDVNLMESGSCYVGF